MSQGSGTGTGRATGRPPGSGSREQLGRLLTLVPYLHARGGVPLAEAAEVLGVTPQVLLRDLKVLFLCGLPGGYPDDLIDVDLDALEDERGRVHGDGVISVRNADYLTRPLRLTPVEATAVIVALRALREGAAPETAGIVDRALAKLEAAAASAGDAGPPVIGAETGDAASLTALTDLEARLVDAASRGLQVELDYYVPTRDEMSHRRVDPRAVVRHGGFPYLDAYCHLAEAPRLFRLDRVAHASVLDTPVAAPGGSDAPSGEPPAADLFSRSEDLARVTVRLAPAAHWVPEYHPVEAVRDVGDGVLEVDLLVADDRWLTKLLLRVAPNAWVTDPDRNGRFTADAQAALDLYG